MDGLPLSFIGEALFNTTSTAHILGGCCMGPTPDKGVVGFTVLKSRIEGLPVYGIQFNRRPGRAWPLPGRA
jgi:cholesterol oxidase